MLCGGNSGYPIDCVSEVGDRQRSNQLNYVPNLFSYLYWKPASLLAFLRFNRFACVACFNLVEPNSEVNGHHGHRANHLLLPRNQDDLGERVVAESCDRSAMLAVLAACKDSEP